MLDFTEFADCSKSTHKGYKIWSLTTRTVKSKCEREITNKKVHTMYDD